MNQLYGTSLSSITYRDLFDLTILKGNKDEGWIGLGGFDVGLELRQQAIADGLGVIPKDDPDPCYLNFDPPLSG